MDSFTRFVFLWALGIVIGLAFSYIDIWNLTILPLTLEPILDFPYLVFGAGLALGLLLAPGPGNAAFWKAWWLKFREGVGDFVGIVFFGAIVFAVIYYWR